MPKRQKEKQYQSAREHRANQSIRSGSSSLNNCATRPLPFDCCALTLTPYTSPVCTPSGIIFDNAAITPYLMKHKSDPVTGRPMTSRDLLVLHIDKDETTGKWQCPVLTKPFTNRTKVVAIRQRPPGNEANVFSYEAYHELNVKAKSNLDLTSGLKFTKEDVIILQDPDDESLVQLRDIHNLKHIKSLREEERSRQLRTTSLDKSDTGNFSGNVRHSVTATRVMEKLKNEKRKREQNAEEETKKVLKSETGGKDLEIPKQKIYTDELLTSVKLTSGKASGSLTSTVMNITRQNDAREATEEEIITSQCETLKSLKKKGVIRMYTNLGAMDLEIHCDIVPRTAMNFVLLAEKGEYEGSKFHRSIPNFMIQGGKKPGSKSGSKGGEGSSYWGKPFPDEFDDRLTHTGPGILSMANSGPGTNARQFFITYKSTPHLNRKHSVFGKVIGGLEILRKLEQLPTDKQTDRPLSEVFIQQMEILDNPVAEALNLERERIKERKEEKKRLQQRKTSSLLGRDSSGVRSTPKDTTVKEATESGCKNNPSAPTVIGKYLRITKKLHGSKKEIKNIGKDHEANTDSDGFAIKSRLPPPPKKTIFRDFSGW